MQPTQLTQIKEIHCDDGVSQIQEAIDAGWLLLGIRYKRRSHEKDQFDDYAIYILGLPSK